MNKSKTPFPRFFAVFSFCLLLTNILVAPIFAGSMKNNTDFAHLVDLISQDSQEGPLFPFAEFNPAFDKQTHRANLSYFKNNPEIISKIKKDLNGGRITWRLEEQKQRLLFVPESRDSYQRQYEEYCKRLVDHVLEQTRLANPYKMIVSLHEEKPEIPADGVTVFLIHNLAKESVTKYIFSSDKSSKTSVMKLRETDFIGRVGSFSTSIYPKADGTFEFVRDTFTIWQNNARNPYTALMIPAEETLHILLREYTEKAIAKELTGRKTLDTEHIQSIADNWLAVEEAMVGGLVRAIVPSFLDQYTGDSSPADLQQDFETKQKYEKYCYLDQGIQLVEQVGIQKAIDLYSKDPSIIKTALADADANLRKRSALLN